MAMPATFHMCSSHNIRFKPQWLCTTQVGRMMSRLHQANISIGSAQAEAQVKCKLEALQRIARGWQTKSPAPGVGVGVGGGPRA